MSRMKRLRKLKQKIKCKIGWHIPRVWGWTEDNAVDGTELKTEFEKANFNPKIEMYYDCVVCNDGAFWDHLYKGKLIDLGNTKEYLFSESIQPLKNQKRS